MRGDFFMRLAFKNWTPYFVSLAGRIRVDSPGSTQALFKFFTFLVSAGTPRRVSSCHFFATSFCGVPPAYSVL